MHERSWTDGDLLLFFRNIKSGIYGGFYESLGSEKILEWSELYWHDRASVAEVIGAGETKPFNPDREKMNPEVFKAMFKNVDEPEKEPKILQTKHSTFMDSEKGFRAYLQNVCLTASNDQLVRFTESWRLVSSQRDYCEIFLEKLLLAGDGWATYAANVGVIMKLEDEYKTGASDRVEKDIARLDILVNDFVKQFINKK